MIEQLLKRNKITNLSLLKIISTTPYQTMNLIQAKTNLSESLIERSIIDLNNDLKNLTDEKFQIVKMGMFYSVSHPKNSSPNMATSYYKLKLAYLTSSTAFQLLILLTVNTKTDISTLTDQLFISKAHFYRNLKKLSTFLLPLSISIRTKNGILQLTGDEIVIRLVLTLLIATTHQTLEWPFPQFPKELITNSKKYHQLKDRLPLNSDYYLAFIFAVTNIRLRNKYFLNNSTTVDAEPLFSIMRNTNDLSSDFDQFPPNFPLEKFYSNLERDFFNMFLRLTLPNVDTPSQKLEIGMSFLDSNHHVARYCSSLCNSFFSHFSLKENKEYSAEFMYYAVIYHASEFYLSSGIIDSIGINSKIPNLFNRSNKLDEIFEFLQEFKESYPKNKINSLNFSDKFYKYFSHIALLFLRMKQPTQIKIHICYTTNIYGTDFLKERIASIFSEKSVLFTSKPEKADLIITNLSSDNFTSIPHYFFPDIYDYQAFKKLFSVIQDIFFEKKISS
ncbi:helix-turn-helix domain-containing protein [Carnobacterium maltaromaticum]|uniref:helix-turn-helix domain-containing protein n=1 Tax=Carnobacterium maltaromaticum TaxID=2751 RepID=UPI00295F1D06|nr:helix-turn-helix domain-containing protein [Carnobacterium maltaromaticum]